MRCTPSLICTPALLRAQAACDLPLNTPNGGGFGGKEKLTACEPTGFSLAAAFVQNTSHPDSRLPLPPQRFLKLGNLPEHVIFTPQHNTTPVCQLSSQRRLLVMCKMPICMHLLFLVMSNLEYFSFIYSHSIWMTCSSCDS